MEHRPWVYIASPYTKGDVAINVKASMDMFHELMDTGIVIPFTPLTSHYLHIHKPRPYQDWINYDLWLLDRFNAVLRIDAICKELNYRQSESSGADGEVDKANKLGIPVFYDKHELLSWALHVYRPVPLASRQLPKHEAGTL